MWAAELIYSGNHINKQASNRNQKGQRWEKAASKGLYKMAE